MDTHGASNGPTEAINGVIETTRRIDRGFRDFPNYKLGPRFQDVPRGRVPVVPVGRFDRDGCRRATWTACRRLVPPVAAVGPPHQAHIPMWLLPRRTETSAR
ncbi:hypothetical protein GU243_20000 [Pseudarthrobacter psychrotolerans]|uniref:Transposase IS204/IS1001/IS1096/IS1165 DDE domain-containing protein n=1 Tax=Pseudarthrobacter psychrotolerans TaxID=2697569 RepID=A0A6P1NQZ3_9MICC|nr:hypothetical protein GU243_20000 [Pseudarthrobacter psychrotolerans]